MHIFTFTRMLSLLPTLALLAGQVSPILAAPVELGSSPATPLLAKRDCSVEAGTKDLAKLINRAGESVTVGTITITVKDPWVLVDDAYTDRKSVEGTLFSLVAQDCEETLCVATDAKQSKNRRCGIPVPNHEIPALYGGKWVGLGGTMYFRTITIGAEPDSLSESKAESKSKGKNPRKELIFLDSFDDERILCKSKKGRPKHGKCPKKGDGGGGGEEE